MVIVRKQLIRSLVALVIVLSLCVTSAMWSKFPVLLVQKPITSSEPYIVQYRESARDDKPILSSRQCTQQERIQHMQRFCKASSAATAPSFMVPDTRSLVDPKHTLRLCWTSKAGCTALKAFVVESFGFDFSHESNRSNINPAHGKRVLSQFNLTYMHEHSMEQRKRISREYFNVLAIRHPFDRISSYYRDKIVDTDTGSAHPERTAGILRMTRPNVFLNNRSLDVLKHPQDILGPPTFAEFLTYVKVKKIVDEHWQRAYLACHVCASNWDAILRMETMATDQTILIKRLNSSLESIPVRHTHQNHVQGLAFSKQLPEYKDVPSAAVDYLLEMQGLDMEMFGYRWDRQTNTAYCAIQTDDGVCC